MQYISTRRQATPLTETSMSGGAENPYFADILLAGLAGDGGLFVPTEWPRFSLDEIRAMRGLSYAEIAARVMAPFIGDCLTPDELRALLVDAYAGFTHPAVAPLKQLGRHEWVMELFHGPTLAFKDYALQVVGRLFDAVLAKRRERVTIIAATSGDTGSAAIEACRDRENVDIFVLYPDGRPSAVQRRQMTTVNADNVHTLAIAGTFDDCQDLVKAMFANTEFRDLHGLSAVNSINWARIIGQVVYYFAAATALGGPDVPVGFSVPTGNFGNVYAGHVARLMGLPIAELVIGTNQNDILYRFIETGIMRIAAVEPSLSPSMDIQVSSNFERLLFEVTGRDGAVLASMMTEFRRSGVLPADPALWHQVRDLFRACRVDDVGTRATIAAVYRETGESLDPHSAVAVAASRHVGFHDTPRVALACAHPAKFPDIVSAVTGRYPDLPPHLADLMQRPERINPVPNDLAIVQNFIARHARRGGIRGDKI